MICSDNNQSTLVTQKIETIVSFNLSVFEFLVGRSSVSLKNVLGFLATVNGCDQSTQVTKIQRDPRAKRSGI